jgi:replicative DNA helicase
MKEIHLITVIPFKTFTTSNAIKVINKYSALGVKYFVLDTFKADSTTGASENIRVQMNQNMVALYDTVKPANKNVHLLCTMQLNKASVRMKKYDLDSIGEAKGISDVSSTAIMMRKLFDDEREGLKVYQDEVDAQGIVHQKIIPLDPRKRYQVFFVVKSREGSTDRQIVAEVDFSRNIYKEIGYCYIENLATS